MEPLKTAPKPVIWHEIVRSYMKLNRMEESVKYIKKAIEAEPNNRDFIDKDADMMLSTIREDKEN